MLREQDGTPDGLRRVMAEQVLTALERSDARRLVCATQPAPPDFNPVAEHVERHQFTELCFCLRGRAEMWVGSQLASCEENQVVIIPAGLALLLFLNAAQGQVLTGSIEGTIKDEQGAVVAGVEIVALRTETNLTRRLQCNESGFFRFEQLPIGRYRVTAARSGFKQLAAEAQVTLGAPVTLNLTLAVGAASETVNVTADAAAVELANAEVSRNVGDRPDLVQPNLLDGTIIDSPNKTLPRAAFSNVATPARI